MPVYSHQDRLQKERDILVFIYKITQEGGILKIIHAIILVRTIISGIATDNYTLKYQKQCM